MRIRERASVGQGDRGCGVLAETQISAPILDQYIFKGIC